ncbi:hypothetical protein J2Z63_000689 [Mycoplasma yeatsii]|uniref:Uncharacterized protein n=1 Tax=Mycoplasma yeatsii TaxID=51365 RepID=A0ABU0NF18_9MOLU|nr:hypothetical protein [Mycoplasma yeatsii]
MKSHHIFNVSIVLKGMLKIWFDQKQASQVL